MPYVVGKACNSHGFMERAYLIMWKAERWRHTYREKEKKKERWEREILSVGASKNPGPEWASVGRPGLHPSLERVARIPISKLILSRHNFRELHGKWSSWDSNWNPGIYALAGILGSSLACWAAISAPCRIVLNGDSKGLMNCYKIRWKLYGWMDVLRWTMNLYICILNVIYNFRCL